MPGWASPTPFELPGPQCRSPAPRVEDRRIEMAQGAPIREGQDQGKRGVPGRARARIWNEPAPKRREPAAGPPSTKCRGIMFGYLAPVPTDPTVDPPPFACFNCWRWGHQMTTYPEPRQAMFCHNCGRREVDLSVCPRYAEVHGEFVRRPYAHERAIERELDERNRAALQAERERREYHERLEQKRRRAMNFHPQGELLDLQCRLEYPKWREVEQAQPAEENVIPLQQQLPPLERPAAIDGIMLQAQAPLPVQRPESTLEATLRLVEGLRGLDPATRQAVLHAVLNSPEQPR